MMTTDNWAMPRGARRSDSSGAAVEPVLDIHDLTVSFPVYGGAVQALKGVSLRVDAGEIVGVVGESGSGKSVTAMTALRLLPPRSYVATGSIQLLGLDALRASEAALRGIRGAGVSMIFQEPMTALNPTRRIGALMREIILTHQPKLGRGAADAHARDLLSAMRIADPVEVLARYPHELSGGMRQRIVIALAFANAPRLVIADEPTTALDVTVQRQVLTLLRARSRDVGAAVLLITHDMAVVSQYTDRVYVMYRGAVVEHGPTRQVLSAPAHPYTQALLAASPDDAPPKSLLKVVESAVDYSSAGAVP